MPKFECHGQIIEARTYEEAYSIRFFVTVAEAIADRDYPATEKELIVLFLESTGRAPTAKEIDTMSPDLVRTIDEEYQGVA